MVYEIFYKNLTFSLFYSYRKEKVDDRNSESDLQLLKDLEKQASYHL